MWGIGALILLFVFVTSIVLPWLNRNAIDKMRHDLKRLQTEINNLKLHGIKPAEKTATAPPPIPARTHIPETISTPVTITPKPEPKFEPVVEIKPVPTPKPKAKTSSGSFEQQFGGRAFVWLGGIALALAGFYLVKYSIDSGLLTEKVRVALGMIFGAALIGGSYFVRVFPRMADGTRISQALAGAGIADLYGCFFAATSLYNLFPNWFGFTGMAAVTALALVMSLSYGAPIALLGLIGGFATPMLIHGEPNTPLLFGYLFLVFSGLSVIIRRQNWLWMAFPATAIAFLWVIFWLAMGPAAEDAIWVSLFLLGVGATVVATTYDADKNDDIMSMPSLLRYLTIGGVALLMAAVTFTAQFSLIEWGMFGMLAGGTLVLAWFDSRTYGFAPWIALGTSAAMLLGWTYADPATYLAIITSFALAFIAGGYVLVKRAENPLPWIGLSAASALIYYLIAYNHLGASLTLLTGLNAMNANEIWSVIAFTGAAFFASATSRLFKTEPDTARRHQQQSVTALAGSSFLSIGLAILLHQEFLPFAIATQILVLSFIRSKADIPSLRYIAMALTGIFGIASMAEIYPLLAAPFNDFKHLNHSPELYHSMTTLLFQFGMPSLMFAGSSILLRKEKDDGFIKTLELLAIGLFTAMVYYVIPMVFSNYGREIAFIARGSFTTLLLALSLTALRTGHWYERRAFIWGGVALGGLAVTRLVGFDIVLQNPVWAHQLVGTLPVINALLLGYGIPALFMIRIGEELKLIDKKELARINNAIALLVGLTFVSLNVRQIYHGAYLDVGPVTNAEIYTYSVVWLLMGVAMLFTGAVRKDKMLRVGSLVIMLLTVGKVFLYDASELTGLWRVISFFGLGMSLLGLSWFYSRFVFTQKPQEKIEE